MLDIQYSGRFKRDYKRALKRGCNPDLLEEVITLLASEVPLPERYRDHFYPLICAPSAETLISSMSRSPSPR